ncbi:VOC family protein [Rhodoligotrophos defluvii]|uniref:VOC family protein n=1 Tax=Rhodoligotrophos defluvii TaxID=2561934 RepID=UPI0010C96998|nr:VOC family protein [Rhodoligotrophos defluvii]
MSERIRLRQICLITAQLEPVIDALMAVFGLKVCYGKADLSAYGLPYTPPPPHQAAFFAQHGLKSAQLPMGDTFLELVAPVRDDTPAARFLKRRGPGGYMVITEVQSTQPFAERVAARGVRLAGTVDYPTYHELQLDPRDVGAAMLSFSMQREGRPFDGGWYPAGPNWREKVQPGMGPIRAAQIKVRDPQTVAEKWSALIGRPAERDSHEIRIGLEQSEIRFAHQEADAPDRLDGIQFDASDFAGAMARAEKAGIPVAENAIIISGLKFRQTGSP